MCAPACSASSASAVPGTTVLSKTTWSASHGCAVTLRRPVKSVSLGVREPQRGRQQRVLGRRQARGAEVAGPPAGMSSQ